MRLIRASAAFSKRAVNSGKMLQVLLNGPRSKLGPQELWGQYYKVCCADWPRPKGLLSRLTVWWARQISTTI